MLSNCTLRQDYLQSPWPYFMYDFKGESMKPVLSDMRRALWDGDHLNCDKKDLLPSIDAGTFEIESSEMGPLYVVHPFFEKEVAGHITEIDFKQQLIRLTFLNPDKEQFPNIILRTYEIQSLYEVVRTDRSTGSKDWCHCGSESDWCGTGCRQPHNKEFVLAMEKGRKPCA